MSICTDPNIEYKQFDYFVLCTYLAVYWYMLDT